MTPIFTPTRVSHWLIPGQEFLPSTGCYRTGRVMVLGQNLPANEWSCPDDYPSIPRHTTRNSYLWYAPGLGSAEAPTDAEIKSFHDARLPDTVWPEVFAIATAQNVGVEAAIPLWRQQESARIRAETGARRSAWESMGFRQAAAPGVGLTGGLGRGLFALGLLAGVGGLIWWLVRSKPWRRNPGCREQGLMDVNLGIGPEDWQYVCVTAHRDVGGKHYLDVEVLDPETGDRVDFYEMIPSSKVRRLYVAETAAVEPPLEYAKTMGATPSRVAANPADISPAGFVDLPNFGRIQLVKVYTSPVTKMLGKTLSTPRPGRTFYAVADERDEGSGSVLSFAGPVADTREELERVLQDMGWWHREQHA